MGANEGEEKFQSAVRISVWLKEVSGFGFAGMVDVSIRRADLCLVEDGLLTRYGAAQPVSIRRADLCLVEASNPLCPRMLISCFYPPCGSLFV